jgi:UDP-glucose 4-epimerase
MPGSVLVTGGAGYIGSHTALALLAAGYEVTILDNLSTGFRELVPAAARLIEGDVADQPKVEKILREGPWKQSSISLGALSCQNRFQIRSTTTATTQKTAGVLLLPV